MPTPSPRRRTPARSARAFVPPLAVLLGLLVVATVIVHRHALHAYFALDDLILLQQAHGIRPWPLTAWRWLSGWAWFHAVVPWWGGEPFPYHATSLLVHVVNVLLLFRLARRWGLSVLGAWFASGLYAASRLHFPALLAATSIGELLSLTFLLMALGWAGPDGRGGPPRTAWAAVAMLLAVSAKESVLLVPFAALLVGPGPLRERARALAPLLATAAAAGAALLVTGIASGRLGGQAYAVSFGANLVENVARLAGWSWDLADPIPDLHATPTDVTLIVAPLAALAVSGWAFARGTPAVRAGAAWWWLAVLPVLPLPGRTYLHYLVVPLAGAALALGGALDALLARRHAAAPPSRRAWLAVAGLLLAYTVWSDVLLSMRMDLRMTSTDWPLDPVLRKSEIARRSTDDVRRHLAGRRASVAILIPASISRPVDLGSGRIAVDTPVRRYALQEVLDDGRSLQAVVPAVDSVAIVHDYEPGRDGWEYFVSQADSHLLPLGPLPLGHAHFVQAMRAVGLREAARDYAEKGLADRPDDAELRAALESLGPSH